MAFSTIDASFYITAGGTGADGRSIRFSYSIPGHTLGTGNAVYLNATGQPVPAIASNIGTSNTVGIIEAIDGSDITVVYQGNISFTGTGNASSSTMRLIKVSGRRL